MSTLPDSLSGFVDGVDSAEKTLLLVNRTEPKPFADLLSEAFENQAVTVAERQIPEGTENLVCLIEDGAVTATTPLSELSEAFLLINVDRYRTGTRQTDLGTFPAVLTGLDGVEFVVSGFPRSAREKLLLIVVSRFIEHRALTHGDGELHSTFQRLSRLDDEYGTRQMYEALADSGVDTHIYGVDDDPGVAEGLGVTVHSGDSEEYRRSWVVVFRPDNEWDRGTTPIENDTGAVALVAVEVGPNVWRSVWTYDADRVEQVLAYMYERF